MKLNINCFVTRLKTNSAKDRIGCCLISSAVCTPINCALEVLMLADQECCSFVL